MPDSATQTRAPGLSPPALSIVSTMYRSRPFLETFLAECGAALAQLGLSDYEIVLVNDGSPDDSREYVRGRIGELPGLVLVDLSRNFGHHPAIMAGLQAARGERIFLIDCDLEVRPDFLLPLWRKLEECGADVAYGYQEQRKGSWFEQFSGGLFWRGFNRLSETRVPENLVTERLMTRRYVQALLSLGDANVFLAGMMSWAGFDQVGVPVRKTQRSGESTYTVLKRVQLMVNAVSSFSSKPLIWLFDVGVLITAGSFAYAFYLVARKLMFGDALLGFTSVMALLALSLGISTMALGLVGVYLGKVFNQVQNRPRFIVRDIVRSRAAAPADDVAPQLQTQGRGHD
ncbi:glycosyltransferase family 2 protein [Paucibacter sp. XJ19-41]|uniref:glycosyltransferase family 2 protein n=1 Tax=Paucibacter sp. XJ19-41 TaxID=2927824 RepID=UPI00234B210D|nr:glycosyltransferase family 2 protein [Paucibacter sp. XJ19-41]MDC6169158.1 glycosyltransferase family 2 protein [Paucibacter sp. XJ19-41]